jgi:mono/diheme cytochrome c family protein
VPAVALATTLLVPGPGLSQTPWIAPASEKAKKNPLSSDPKSIELGRFVAKANCVPCHGETFKGNGPAAIALNPKPADWTSPRVQDQSDGELFWRISTGRGAMPSWKQLPERERWAVLRFIKTLKP